MLSVNDLQDPWRTADWISVQGIPLTFDEARLLMKIKERGYFGEASSVRQLHELRILYWQVVGFLRAKEK